MKLTNDALKMSELMTMQDTEQVQAILTRNAVTLKPSKRCTYFLLALEF